MKSRCMCAGIADNPAQDFFGLFILLLTKQSLGLKIKAFKICGFVASFTIKLLGFAGITQAGLIIIDGSRPIAEQFGIKCQTRQAGIFFMFGARSFQVFLRCGIITAQNIQQPQLVNNFGLAAGHIFSGK